MPSDLTPFIAPERAAARQLAVAQVANAILDHATRVGRIPGAGEPCPPLLGLAAQARAAIAVNGATHSDRLAALVSGLRSGRINADDVDAVVDEFERFAAEIEIHSGGDVKAAARELRVARVARRAYEQAHPEAKLWRARSRRWRRWIVPAGGIVESVGGGYILSQATRFPGGWIGGGIAMGAMFGLNVKLGQISGRLRAGKEKRLSGGLKALALVVTAIGLDVMLGCLRADLPFTVDALRKLITDPVAYYSAWLVIAMELSVFFGVAAFSFKRERSGDTAHHELLCMQDERAEKALRALRTATEQELDDARAESFACIAAQGAAAAAASAAAQSLYDDVHAERRAFRSSIRAIRCEAAAVVREAYDLVLNQSIGASPTHVPDFDKEMAVLVPEPMDGVAELAWARQAYASIREQTKDVCRHVQKARRRLNNVRLDILKTIYAEP